MTNITGTTTGIYSVVHSDKGDFPIGTPVEVHVDGQLTSYYFELEAPFDCRVSAATLHVGRLSARVRLELGPIRQGQPLLIEHPIHLDNLGGRA